VIALLLRVASSGVLFVDGVTWPERVDGALPCVDESKLAES